MRGKKQNQAVVAKNRVAQGTGSENKKTGLEGGQRQQRDAQDTSRGAGAECSLLAGA